MGEMRLCWRHWGVNHGGRSLGAGPAAAITLAAATPAQLPLRKDPRLREPVASRQSSIHAGDDLGEVFQAKLLWMVPVTRAARRKIISGPLAWVWKMLYASSTASRCTHCHPAVGGCRLKVFRIIQKESPHAAQRSPRHPR